MHAHARVTAFPDPTDTPPPANPAGYAISVGLVGANFSLNVPASIGVNTPVFKQAAKACNFH